MTTATLLNMKTGDAVLADISDVTASAATLNASVSAPVAGIATGYKVARGAQAATASAAIATGLTSIVGYAVSDVGATAAKANYAPHISSAVSSGTLTVYRWKHTGATTATLVAATTAGTVSWVAVGT